MGSDWWQDPQGPEGLEIEVNDIMVSIVKFRVVAGSTSGAQGKGDIQFITQDKA